jgi:hypothetical protein
MADGFFPVLVSKDANPNLVTDPIFVEITDGTNAITSNGTGSLNVNVTNASLSVTQGTSPWVVSLTSTTITGTVAVTQSTSPWVVNVADWGGTATSLGQKVSASSVPVVIASDQSAIPVSTAIAASAGAFDDYLTSAAVASNATATHTYTVSTTALLTEISMASSGASKWQLQYGPTASPVIHWTGFINKQGGELHIMFNPPISVPNTSTGVIQLVATNRESTAQDVYSTMFGTD